MSDYVLDASAILALLNAEAGADVVQQVLPSSVISTVNLAEVVTRLSAVGMPDTQIREALSILGLKSVPFDEEQAFQVGLLYPITQASGLSLGDRACLALAQTRSAQAVTADRVWGELKLGVEVKVIR